MLAVAYTLFSAMKAHADANTFHPGVKYEVEIVKFNSLKYLTFNVFPKSSSGYWLFYVTAGCICNCHALEAMSFNWKSVGRQAPGCNKPITTSSVLTSSFLKAENSYHPFIMELTTLSIKQSHFNLSRLLVEVCIHNKSWISQKMFKAKCTFLMPQGLIYSSFLGDYFLRRLNFHYANGNLVR